MADELHSSNSINLLDVALRCIERGWYVFPCKPRGKQPMTPNGYKDATLDIERVRQWWGKTPNANVAIATGMSGLTVLDCDHGFHSPADVAAFRSANALPDTYTVRSGRRPEFGVQMYFTGQGLKSIPWEDGRYSGDVRGATGYVIAEGSIHPDSGERYEVASVDAVPAPMPDWVRSLRAPDRADRALTTDEPITEWRNDAMTRILGKARNAGLSDDIIRAHAIEVNERRMQPPLDADELERLITNACKWQRGEPEPQVVLGKAVDPSTTAPVDWRTRYATLEQFRDVKPPSFLIQDFLEHGSITAIGAPVAQRKSIVVANIIHALLTGEPLFGHFEVVQKPERILYLCPEMGLVDIANRFKKLGLESYVGETLFIRSMDDEKLSLTELDEELPGALVILDTITRFVAGNQNDAGDMAKFADLNYAIRRRGATLLLLHHAVKGTAGNMTLDTALRGSTELAAFVTCVWSTQLQNPDAPHTTASNLKCVKQRGFASEPFQVSCDEQFRMKMLGTVGEIKTQKQVSSEAALAAILKESPEMGINKLQAALRAVGHKRGVRWVTDARLRAGNGGVILTN